MTRFPEQTTAERATDLADELAPGSQLARYVLRRVVGSGGMGVVWAAYDPDLDREVAIKVLRGVADPASRTRLLREARAMARLKHPNVMTVHEVGTERNRDYVVMELVEGGSLDKWLATHPPRAEVIAALLAAGRGLAAAHAAGLVHRDFKPHNVLRASDGRVLVTDFGLAREHGLPVELPPPHASAPPRRLEDTLAVATARPVGTDSVLASPLTGTGLVIGTPAYMAPEQLGGAPSDARTDQFAFCVSAWQALDGKRPFVGDSLDALRAATEQGPAGVRARLPRGIRVVLERGLDPDPTGRWPDLDQLLAALERTRRRRTLVAIAVAVAAAAIALGLGIHRLVEHRAPAPCTGSDRTLAEVWNPHVAATAHAAFIATHLPYAPRAWQRTQQVLDAIGHDWIAMHDDACRATAVRREQSGHVLDLRMSCLAERLSELRAVVELFGRADGSVVEKAQDVLAGLSPIAGCIASRALEAAMRPPRDAATRAQVDAVRAALARAKALQQTGNDAAALAVADPARANAEAAGYAPALAEALLEVGNQQSALRQPGAVDTLTHAFLAAEACGYDRIATLAAAALIKQVGVIGGKPDDGSLWANIAQAILTRTGDRSDEAAVGLPTGELLITQGRYDDALAALRHALDQATAAQSPYGLDQDLSILHDTIGIALAKQGKLDDALREMRLGNGLARKVYGPDHPETATGLANIGSTLADHGSLDDALAAHREALAIRQKAYGDDDPDVATSLLDIGAILAEQGKPDEALVDLRRGLAILVKVAGPEHPAVAAARMMVAEALLARGAAKDAEPELRAVLAIREKVLGPEHPDVARSLASLGEALDKEGKPADAVPLLERALAIQTARLGADHPDTAITLGTLGEAHLALRDLGRAADELSRALHTFEVKAPRPEVLGELRFAFAKARWGQGEHAAAVALAQQARGDFSQLPARAKERTEVDAWLAAHPR